MKRVLIVNQGKSANLGDKAIRLVLKKYFEEAGYEVSNAGYTHFEENTIGDFDISNYKMVRRFDFPVLIKWILKKRRELRQEMQKYRGNYDYFILGGGQLVKSKCYFPYAFAAWTRFGRKYAKHKYIIGVGSDTDLKWCDRKKYRYHLKEYERILVRDTESFQTIKNLGIKNVSSMPDVAYLMCGYLEKDLVQKEERDEISLIMIFDYNTYKYHFHEELDFDAYRLFWEDKIRQELELNHKVLLGYTTVEDKKQTIEIYNTLPEIYKNQVHILDLDNLDDLMKELMTVKYIYSGRMHALILGMTMGCEVHGIPVSDKLRIFENEYLMASLSAEDYKEIILREMKKNME